jgi:hypothetical protein
MLYNIGPRLTISLPQGSPLALELMNENSTDDPDDGSNTAPIFVGPPDQQRPRHFSFGETLSFPGNGRHSFSS